MTILNKLYWTKNQINKDYKQFSFDLPCGYYIYNIEEVVVKHNEPTLVNLGVSIYSEEPITLIYTKALLSNDFYIIDSVQIIPPKQSIDLFINVINPNNDLTSWTITNQSLIARMVIVNTSYTNLFEINSKNFKAL